MPSQFPYCATIVVPAGTGKFIKPQRRPRSTITTSRKGAQLLIKISAKDASALKASIASVARDIAIIDSTIAIAEGK